MIDLLKASAGSGKTYRLSHYYIDLLMDEKAGIDTYRHILAVTFTNKATEEMKGRILKDLYEISQNPKESSSRRQKAAKILQAMLHDYSAFCVSTIDKFFQRTLRAFARELGQMASYQVELDKTMLCDKAVDLILDELGTEDPRDKDFIEYVLDNVRENLQNGKPISIERSLKEMALRLKSEEFVLKSRAVGLDVDAAYSTDRLKKLRKDCRGIIDKFKSEIQEKAQSVVLASESAGLIASDYSGGSSSWFNKVVRMSQGSLESLNLDKASNPDKWFAKANADLLDKARPAIEDKLNSLVQCYEKGIELYNTADLINANLYGLGIAARLYQSFNRILTEENLICLDESNTLLKDIINNSDAPFVYEKIGVNLTNFLLDEFQDTSLTQWDNFLPLLRESNSNNNRNLIVGDVKQSIYRWRNSDWSLLDTGVSSSFRPEDLTQKPMQENFRSCQAIVDFNNDFYPSAAGKLGESIAEIYKDVKQDLGKTVQNNRGKVNVCFMQDVESELDHIVDVIRRECENGFKLSDFAVLVRRNADGTAVAQRLVREGIEVITEASLSIKNSLSVRRLVSLMSCVNSPDVEEEDSLGKFIAVSLGLENIPTSYHGLADLADKLYEALQNKFPEDCSKDVTYVTAFMDYVMEYSAGSGDNLGEFLKKWEDVDPTIQSPLDSDAVKILSIHKSKGLAFPFVILPFVEQIKFYRDRRMWCQPDSKIISGTPLADIGNILFDIPLIAKAGTSAFSDYYKKEKYDQAVDAINMMYVATTRAVNAMEIIAKDGANKENFAGILKEFWKDKKYGFPDFLPQEEKESETGTVRLNYWIHPLEDRLSIRPYALDFFTEADASFNELSFKSRGTVLHDILSRVKVLSDLQSAVRDAVVEGLIGEEDVSQVEKLLAARIASHPEFFPCEKGMRVLNETTVMGADGRQHRADRVIIRPDGSVLVVDYKFGRPKQEYKEQIEEYRTIFKQMGHTSVEAHLWFVYQNKID